LDGIERVRQAARKERKQRFTALMHHVYHVDRLRPYSDRLLEEVDVSVWRAHRGVNDGFHQLLRRSRRAFGLAIWAGNTTEEPTGNKERGTHRAIPPMELGTRKIPAPIVNPTTSAVALPAPDGRADDPATAWTLEP
jgi:hypothetical protein